MEKPNIKEYSNTPLLDTKNYPLWNIMMYVELTEQGLKDICGSEIASNSDITTIRNWNRPNGKPFHRILSIIHPTLLVNFVDTITSRNAKALWQRIKNKFASHTVVNRGRMWLRWEYLCFNGNIKE
ncbi:hypothetical protein O181_064087 [Austropuccinia psidii MF-1]|uniref:DUF4219 domain-containing protein n=1 Tax=Austropuccinia psidii MF-1 TaxID=1389203 RepID=A0A9Q3EV41_9BASI|nr:hypothetical protein [Austropuccinia psidii MF-1]